MAETTSLAEVLKSVSLVGANEVTNLLCSDSDGTLKRTSASSFLSIRRDITDLNTLATTCLVRCSSATLNSPFSDANGTFCLSMVHGNGWVFQMVFQISMSIRIKVRAQVSGTWSAWKQVAYTS